MIVATSSVFRNALVLRVACILDEDMGTRPVFESVSDSPIKGLPP